MRPTYDRYRVAMPQDAWVNERPRARSFKRLRAAMECAAGFYHTQSPFHTRFPVFVVTGSGSDYRVEGLFGARGWRGNILAGYHAFPAQAEDYGSAE